MALQQSPFGTYANVTGVVNTTAAAEIVVLFTNLLALLPDSANGTPGGTPDFDAIRPDVEQTIRAEINAVKAAIAAAPTV